MALTRKKVLMAIALSGRELFLSAHDQNTHKSLCLGDSSTIVLCMKEDSLPQNVITVDGQIDLDGLIELLEAIE